MLTSPYAAIDEQIKSLTTSINSQFTDMRRLPYRLQAVFIHRGYVSSGHYWIYIYDFAKEIWRKYNDGYVTEVKDTREIFDQEPGDRPATPYFLVYVKDELKDKLVDPVCRDPIEPPKQPSPSQNADVEMTNTGNGNDTMSWTQSNDTTMDTGNGLEGTVPPVPGWNSRGLAADSNNDW